MSAVLDLLMRFAFVALPACLGYDALMRLVDLVHWVRCTSRRGEIDMVPVKDGETVAALGWLGATVALNASFIVCFPHFLGPLCAAEALVLFANQVGMGRWVEDVEMAYLEAHEGFDGGDDGDDGGGWDEDPDYDGGGPGGLEVPDDLSALPASDAAWTVGSVATAGGS